MKTPTGRWLIGSLATAACGLSLASFALNRVEAADDDPMHATNTLIDPPEFFGGFAEKDGQQLYESICQGCHMPDAKGAKGAGMYPALTSNPKLSTAVYSEYVVLNGLRGMPRFGKVLNDAQVAAVVNYVITHFGNQAASLATEEEVKALRASQ